MEDLKGADAVTNDVPTKNFFIDVGKQDAGGELGEISILFHQGLRVENDGILELIQRDVTVDGATKFRLDLFTRQAQVEIEQSKIETLLEIKAIPKDRFLVVDADHDHELLAIVLKEFSLFSNLAICGFFSFLFALANTHFAILDVSFGGLVMALAHHLFFHQVLKLLDVDELLALSDHALGQRACDVGSQSRILLDGEESFANRYFDLVRVPCDNLTVATDDFGGHK